MGVGSDPLRGEGVLPPEPPVDPPLYREICSATDQHQIQVDLDALERWSDEWLIRFNAESPAYRIIKPAP